MAQCGDVLRLLRLAAHSAGTGGDTGLGAGGSLRLGPFAELVAQRRDILGLLRLAAHSAGTGGDAGLGAGGSLRLSPFAELVAQCRDGQGLLRAAHGAGTGGETGLGAGGRLGDGPLTEHVLDAHVGHVIQEVLAAGQAHIRRQGIVGLLGGHLIHGGVRDLVFEGLARVEGQQAVQHVEGILGEACVRGGIDTQGAQGHQHLGGGLAAAGRARHLGERTVGLLHGAEPGQRLVHSGLHRFVGLVVGGQRLDGHGGHVHVIRGVGAVDVPRAAVLLQGQDGLHQRVAGHAACGGIAVAVQGDQRPHRAVGALPLDVLHIVQTGQQIEAAHIGDVLADGRQGQDQTGVVRGLIAVEPVGGGVDLGLDIGQSVVVVALRHGAAAAGQADGHPLAADAAHDGRALAGQIVAGGLIGLLHVRTGGLGHRQGNGIGRAGLLAVAGGKRQRGLAHENGGVAEGGLRCHRRSAVDADRVGQVVAVRVGKDGRKVDGVLVAERHTGLRTLGGRRGRGVGDGQAADIGHVSAFVAAVVLHIGHGERPCTGSQDAVVGIRLCAADAAGNGVGLRAVAQGDGGLVVLLLGGNAEVEGDGALAIQREHEGGGRGGAVRARIAALEALRSAVVGPGILALVRHGGADNAGGGQGHILQTCIGPDRDELLADITGVGVIGGIDRPRAGALRVAGGGHIGVAIGLPAQGAGTEGVALLRAGGRDHRAAVGLVEGHVLLPLQSGIAAAGRAKGLRVQLGGLHLLLRQHGGVGVRRQGVAAGDGGRACVHAAKRAVAAGDSAHTVAVGDSGRRHQSAGPVHFALQHAADTAGIAAGADRAGVVAVGNGNAVAAVAEHAAGGAAGGGDSAGVVAAGDDRAAADEAADDAAHIAAAGDSTEVGAVPDGGGAAGIAQDAARIAARAADSHIAEAVLNDDVLTVGVARHRAAAGGRAAQGQVLDVRAVADLLEQAAGGVQTGDLTARAVQLDLLAAVDIQPGVLAQLNVGSQNAGHIGGLALVHEPGQLRAGGDLIHAALALLGLGLAAAVPGGVRGDRQRDGELVRAVLGDGDRAGDILHALAGDGVKILLGIALEAAVVGHVDRVARGVLQGDGQRRAGDGLAVAAHKAQLAGEEVRLGQRQCQLGQTSQNTGGAGRIEARVRTGGIGDAAVGGYPRPTGLLDRTGQGVAAAVPILGNGDADELAGRVAAEVVHTEVAAGVGLEECAVLTLIVQGEVEVIRAGQLLLGADQVAELQVHGVAGLEGRLGGLRQLLAIVVHQFVADAPGGDDLIVSRAVLLHLDDVAARGQAGNGDRAVLRHGDALGGKAAEGHLVAHGGAGHGDGAAILGLEAVGSALIAQIEQDVVLRVQNALLVLGDSGIHAVQRHVGLDARAVAAHGHHEHAGALRPDGGELTVGSGGGHTLHIGHGIIRHQHNGRTGLVGGHGGHVAVLGVRDDGHHVAGVAVGVDDLIVHIRQGHLGVHKALDGEPVAEGVQLERLAHGHALVALGVDVQIDVSAVIHVLFKAVDRVLGKALVADVQILRRQGDGVVRAPVLIVPVGHAVGVLHPVEIVRVLIHAVGDGVGLRIAAHGLDEGVHIVLGQRTHGNGRVLRHTECDVHASLAGGGETVVHGGGLLRGGRIEGRPGYRVGRDRGLHGIAYHEDAAVVGFLPRLALAADSPTRRSGAHLVVGGGDLHIQGVVRAQHPVGVHGDLIDALDLGRVLAGLDRQGQAAVAVVVGVIALYPVVAHRQRQGIGGVGDRHIRQQVGVAPRAVGVGVELEILDLRVVETAEGQLAAAAVIDLGGNRRVHQRIDPPLLLIRIAIAGSRQHAGSGFAIHGERGLTVFIGNSPVNRCFRTGDSVHPNELHALQRLGCGLQVGGGLVEIAAHGVEALHGDGDLVAVHHCVGNILQPGIVIGIAAVVLHDVEVQHIAIVHLGVGGECAVVAAAVGGRRAVIGIALVQIEAAGIGRRAEDGADPAAAAHVQIVLCRLLGEILTEGQLMGADQHVQRGHAVHLVGKAVLLRQIRRHRLLLREAVEISARRLRADGHLRRGNHRRVRRDHRNSIGGGGNSRRGVLALAAGLLCVAAADGQHRAVRHGDRRRAAVGGLAHGQIDLVLLVGCGGSDSDLLHALRQLQSIAGGVLVEVGRQLTGAEAQGRQAGVVHRRPAAADVRAAIEGKHDADLIAVSQFAVGHGKFRKAAVGEPVVQRAHPAAALAAVKLAQSRIALGDLADITLVRAHGGVARRIQRTGDAAHHGGIGRQGHVGVHQRTFQVSALHLGIGRVLHDDVDTSEAAFASLGHFGPHGGGDQAQRHDQCQEERNYAFLHLSFPPCDFLCSLYKRLSALLPCPRSGRGGGRGPAWPLPPLWKADDLRSDRHGLTKIRVLRVPSNTKKRRSSACAENQRVPQEKSTDASVTGNISAYPCLVHITHGESARCCRPSSM